MFQLYFKTFSGALFCVCGGSCVSLGCSLDLSFAQALPSTHPPLFLQLAHLRCHPPLPSFPPLLWMVFLPHLLRQSHRHHPCITLPLQMSFLWILPRLLHPLSVINKLHAITSAFSIKLVPLNSAGSLPPLRVLHAFPLLHNLNQLYLMGVYTPICLLIWLPLLG